MYHNKTHLSDLVEIVRTLRGDDGCPWDQRQSTESMSKYLKAEVAELLLAIDNRDVANTCEEIGDVLYVLVMIAEINRAEGNFSLDDVLSGITAKLVRRHPHVFAGKKISDESELRKQWEEIKAQEKSGKFI
ncbi:MAG: MazG nucleotide pyrophosphohydrolase domain-containing protein [Desulfopila sp.]